MYIFLLLISHQTLIYNLNYQSHFSYAIDPFPLKSQNISFKIGKFNITGNKSKVILSKSEVLQQTEKYGFNMELKLLERN